jgi:hypothetical protein
LIILFASANCFVGAANTSVRDQVIRYNPQTGVFCRSYINEKVRFIVQDTVLDQPTDAGFLCAFIYISLTCDPRAPVDMPEEIMNALPPDPEITELKREHEEYRKIYRFFSQVLPEIRQECEQLCRQIDSLEKQREQAIKIEYQRDYFYCIYNEELEKQLSKVAAIKYIEPVVYHQLLERTQLQEAICDLSKDLSLSDIVSRRVRVIDLMVVLSYRREVQCCKCSSRACSESSVEQPLPEDPFPLICKKTQCIICIGDDRSTYEYRMRTYATPNKMMNYVVSYLQGVPASQRISCGYPVCQSEGLVLNNLQHFKYYVATVHGITLRA